MSTCAALARATAAWASSELSLVIASLFAPMLFSGDPSALPGEPWSNLSDPALPPTNLRDPRFVLGVSKPDLTS